MTEDTYLKIIKYAVKAPSGHNTQPWKFRIENNSILILPDFARVGYSNVFPMLGQYDQIIRFERQKKCYDERLISMLEKGHITGALAFEKLRRHILKNTENL